MTKKVEFVKDDEKTVEVYVDDDLYGTLELGDEEYGDQKGVWILWDKLGQDGVTYFDDLKETESTIKYELEN